ncbi:MAG TPA: Flp pilus assembly protein CpaB [Gaiellaceae bacterium]|nr:Flp pilus assembly protein CpaB [Gaiellaceae bacterium]
MQRMLANYRLRNTLVAGGLAAVGALLVFVYVSTYRKHVQSGADLVSVYVASRDIAAGTDASTAAGMFKKETVLKRNVVPGAISAVTQVGGLVVSRTILQGEQVTVRQFSPLSQQGVLGTIAGNVRAIELPGDPNQLLYGIVHDGDHVDVIANIGYSLRTSNGSVNLVATRVVLRNLLVLHAPQSSGSRGIGDVQTSGTSITLAVTDSQAQKLLFAAKNGSWWLVLRPLSKPTDLPDSVETMQSILGDGLGAAQIDQLTNGRGRGAIGGGQ